MTGSVHVPRTWPAAKSSSFTSLRRSPDAALGKQRGLFAFKYRDGAGSGGWGAVRSEVKEEGRAQPGPGDMSGAQRPIGLISRRPTQAQLQALADFLAAFFAASSAAAFAACFSVRVM